MITSKKSLDAFDAQTFGSVMGQAVWLMTMSNHHRDKPIKSIEDFLAPAVLLQQFKLYSKDDKPIAFLVWASVSDQVKAKIDQGDYSLEVGDWRSGSNIVVLDCVSPFTSAEVITKKFLTDARTAQDKAKAQN